VAVGREGGGLESARDRGAEEGGGRGRGVGGREQELDARERRRLGGGERLGAGQAARPPREQGGGPIVVVEARGPGREQAGLPAVDEAHRRDRITGLVAGQGSGQKERRDGRGRAGQGDRPGEEARGGARRPVEQGGQPVIGHGRARGELRRADQD